MTPEPFAPVNGARLTRTVRTATNSKITKEGHRSAGRLLLVRNLSLAQRVVLVVALGLALLAVDDYTMPRSSGWFATASSHELGYAPDTSITYVPEDGRLSHLALRVLLVAVWAAVSVFVLRSPKK